MNDGDKTKEELIEELKLLRLELQIQGPPTTGGEHKDKDHIWYRFLLSNISDLAYICDDKGNILYLNSAFEDISGHKPEAFINKSFAPLFSEDSLKKAMEEYSRTLKGESRSFELEFKSTGVMCAYKNTPYRDKDGNIIGVLGTARDVTVEKRAEEALKASREKYSSLFNNMLNGFAYHKIILDEDGRPVDYIFLEINNYFEALTGLKREDVIGKRVTEVLPGIEESDFDWIGEYGKVAMEGGELRTEQYSEFLDRWYSILAFSNSKGYFATVFENITERKLAEEELGKYRDHLVELVEERTLKLDLEIEKHKKSEEALKKSEEKYRSLVETTTAIIWTADESGGFTAPQHSWEKFTGQPWSEHKGFGWTKMIHADDIDRILREWKEARKEQLHYKTWGRVWNASLEEYRHFEVNAVPILRAAGLLSEWVGIIEDITERKRSEREADRNYHFQRVISSILQVSLKPISLNEILQYSLEAILSVPFISILEKGSIFLAEENGEMLRLEVFVGLSEALQEMCATIPFGHCACGRAAASRDIVFIDDVNEVHESRYEGIVPHGHYCVPIILDGTVLGVINTYVPEGHISMTDEEQFLTMAANTLAGIIDRKRNEKKREELQSQLFHSQKMEAIARLTGGIAHDFNNLMTAINVFSSLGKDEASGDERTYFTEINNAGKRAIALTRQLSLFSKKRPSNREIVDVNKLIGSNLAGIISSLIGDSILVRYDLSAELRPVKADSSNIEQVIMNLIVNARDAMELGGSLTVRTLNRKLEQKPYMARDKPAAGDFICIEVTDTGTGMDKETVEVIFEPFFTTKTTEKGTGIGLSVVYNIVEGLDGCVEVESELEKGSTFRVFIPSSDEQCVKEASPASSHAAEDLRGDGELIMLVEDEEVVYNVTTELLTRNGYRVEGVSNLNDALSLFEGREGEISLLLSDIALPDGNGLNLAEELISVKPELRVIFFSGYTDYDAQLPRIRELGFYFMEKPFEPQELLKAVKDEISKGGS